MKLQKSELKFALLAPGAVNLTAKVLSLSHHDGGGVFVIQLNDVIGENTLFEEIDEYYGVELHDNLQAFYADYIDRYTLPEDLKEKLQSFAEDMPGLLEYAKKKKKALTENEAFFGVLEITKATGQNLIPDFLFNRLAEKFSGGGGDT